MRWAPSPRLLLATQLLAIAIVGGVLGAWRLQIHPDSYSYISASKMEFVPALSQTRTLGYPLVLRLLAPFSPDYSIIPWVQLAILWPSVFLFDLAVRRFGSSPWEAFVVSSGFMYGAIQQPWTVASLLTDIPATVVAGVAIACLFWIVSSPRHLRGWLGLTFFLTAAYHVRPAYLFLVVVAPSLGLLLGYVRARSTRSPFSWKKLLAGLLGASLVPLFLFCALRWVAVGEFGLVSFGGSTRLGLSAELLDSRMAQEELSQRFRPFAQEILRGRQERSLKSAFPGKWWVDMRAYEDNYSVNIFLIGYPSAKRLFGEDRIVLNRELALFSKEVIGLRKGKYLLWAVQYWPRAAMKVAYRYWILQMSLAVALVLFGLSWLKSHHRHGFNGLSPAAPRAARQNTPILIALFWLNIFYIAGAISVLILAGSYADSRLICPAAVYLPSLVGLLIRREFEAPRPTAFVTRPSTV